MCELPEPAKVSVGKVPAAGLSFSDAVFTHLPIGQRYLRFPDQFSWNTEGYFQTMKGGDKFESS